MSKINLLKETEQVLEDHGYTWDDVQAVQRDVCDAYSIPLESFKKLADREYDHGYGIEEVNTDLVILIKDGTWFARKTLGGSEWWKHYNRPDPAPVKESKIVLSDIWDSLAMENNGWKDSDMEV